MPVILLDGCRHPSTETLRFAFAEILPPAAIRTCWLVSGDPLDPAIRNINLLLRKAFVAQIAPDVVFYPLHADDPCDDDPDSPAGDFATCVEYLLSLSPHTEILETCLLYTAAPATRKKSKTLPRKLASADALVSVLRDCLMPFNAVSSTSVEHSLDNVLLSQFGRLLAKKDRSLRTGQQPTTAAQTDALRRYLRYRPPRCSHRY